MEQKTSLGDAVGLVVETIREHFIEILQFLIFQNLRVQSCHTVHRVAGHNGQVGHLHLSVIDDGHLADLVLYVDAGHVAVFFLDLKDKSAVDLLHDLIYAGQQSGEQLNGPFFQSFSHNGMVGIGAGPGGHSPCLVPGKEIFIHQYTHQLGDGHGGMGIVELESHLFIELADIAVGTHVFCHGLLYRGGDKEVLLF